MVEGVFLRVLGQPQLPALAALIDHTQFENAESVARSLVARQLAKSRPGDKPTTVYDIQCQNLRSIRLNRRFPGIK